jgi:hypothetical protein
MKSIMTGKKFHQMLRYIHVCSIENQPDINDTEYDPIYKVEEMKNYLEHRYDKLFIPGQQLSLDESLIRAFGRIKFKVRIISKSARYGVKVYVLTDAATAFVLKVIVYTGKHTYNQSESPKKTVQVVEELCSKYQGSHRSIYIDRFYTSIDLVKSMDKMGLYVTGTMMKNRIPKELTIAKSTRQFKDMARGDFKKHVFEYKDNTGNTKKYGLVCWKDRDIVYCLTNEWPTDEVGVCYRRSASGVICIERPKVVEKYNEFMGGVDLADMRRLHCNSTIMGQNRWWLKLFFYLLDVGTSNALVLYKEATKPKNDKMTIVEFKTKLVESFQGEKLRITAPKADEVHTMEKTNARHICAYCSLFSQRRRTRFRCSHPTCKVPLCSVGAATGRVGEDCFALCHDNQGIRSAVVKKYEAMKKKTNSKCKD